MEKTTGNGGARMKTEEEIKDYLDQCIYYWRDPNEEHKYMAKYYIDAFQSIRLFIFGELKE